MPNWLEFNTQLPIIDAFPSENTTANKIRNRSEKVANELYSKYMFSKPWLHKGNGWIIYLMSVKHNFNTVVQQSIKYLIRGFFKSWCN